MIEDTAKGGDVGARVGDRGAGRKAEILDAAAVVFAQVGYHRARMDDIVEHSGLSKGTLYWHFNSKEALASALVHRELASEAKAIEQVMTTDASPRAKLETLVRAFARELEEQPERGPLTLDLLALAHTIPQIKECFSEHHVYFLGQIQEALTDLTHAAGKSRSDSELAAAASALAALVDGYALRWTLSSSEVPLEDALWEAARVVLDGVTSSDT